MSSEPEPEFSARERRALAAWRVPPTPSDLSARVLSGLGADRSQGSARPMAVAALAVVVVGGLFLGRLLSAGAPITLPAADAHLSPADGGAAVEVGNRLDGIRS